MTLIWLTAPPANNAVAVAPMPPPPALALFGRRAPPANTAVAGAPMPPPPARIMTGACEYPDPPSVTVMAVTVPPLTVAVAAAVVCAWAVDCGPTAQMAQHRTERDRRSFKYRVFIVLSIDSRLSARSKPALARGTWAQPCQRLVVTSTMTLYRRGRTQIGRAHV